MDAFARPAERRYPAGLDHSLFIRFDGWLSRYLTNKTCAMRAAHHQRP
jgi:hypothetical protein